MLSYIILALALLRIPLAIIADLREVMSHRKNNILRPLESEPGGRKLLRGTSHAFCSNNSRKRGVKS